MQAKEYIRTDISSMKTKQLLILICVVAVHRIDATKYVVTNTVPHTPGGKFFDQELGVRYTLGLMPILNRDIFYILKERYSWEQRNVPVLNVYISEFPGYAYKNGNNINISASALDNFYYPRNKSKLFFSMMLIHEMTHVFQWHGNFGAPGGLTEGTADYVMVKSGIYEEDKYTKPGAGKRWDQGYGVTERFLEYCDGLVEDFTVKLNKMMRYKYSDSYWVELLGKPVDQVWTDYKAKYGNMPQTQNYSIGTFQGLEY
ncbi:uncharacterized protein LOC130998048 [Salvia miltiorrhiza]|uniref:uncharacterized protein LOC130998048 n=1 Tax=Salvia miltiorrhiza TaxID=226208 RepID=UPI0025AD21DF|nr:uncharacterized protein LOC130998048 [Salvia miltiorrhiza]